MLKVHAEKRKAAILIVRTKAQRPGSLGARSVELGIGEVQRIRSGVEVTVVNIRENKVRLGFNMPHGRETHRLEVFEALRRGKADQDDDDDPEDGAAGSPVPKPRPPRRC